METIKESKYYNCCDCGNIDCPGKPNEGICNMKENNTGQTVYEQLQEFLNKYPGNYKLTIDHFIEAMRIAHETNKIAATMLQRKMALGFATSAYLLDTMEKFGFIGPQNGVRPRDIHIEKIGEYLSKAKLPTKSE